MTNPTPLEAFKQRYERIKRTHLGYYGEPIDPEAYDAAVTEAAQAHTHAALVEFAEKLKEHFVGSNTGRKSEQIAHVEYKDIEFTGEEVGADIDAVLAELTRGETDHADN